MSGFREFLTVGSPVDRAMAFLLDYIEAPDDADVEFRIGKSDAGEPAIIVDVGKRRHAFTATEGRIVAGIAEDTYREFPHERDSAGFPNLILGLRAAVDKAIGVSPTKSGGETK